MKLPVAARLVFLAAFALPCTAQTLMRAVNGPAASARFGRASIQVPDQNGDGFKDVLVGAPGYNQARGAIYCVSGRYLANGTGASILWSLAPSANADDQFGAALADVGDVTGDGVHDFLVGQPGYDYSTATGQQGVGAVRLVHGSAHTVVSLIRGSYADAFGTSLAACGDLNANGFGDVAIGGPSYSIVGVVRVLDGSVLTQSGEVSTLDMAAVSGINYGDQVGASVAGGADLTGDGVAEIVIGAPGVAAGGASGAGQVIVYDAVANQSYKVSAFVTYEGLGRAVSVGGDYDGDGVADIVAGAPYFENGTGYDVGRAVVFSGARVVAQTPPYEIYSFPFGSASPPINHGDPDPNYHFGAAVSAGADLNKDGVGDIIVGAPDYFSQGFPSGWSYKGVARIYSGATGMQLMSIGGGMTDRLGDGLGVIADLDGDGHREFVLAGSLSDAGGTDSGVLKCYRLFPVTPSIYCVGKVNSQGCTPAMGFSGSPSVNSGAPFTVSASNVINQKIGLLYYGHAPTSVFFQGGTKCVASPTLRTPTQSSGGATSGADCSGVFSFDFNALIASGADASLVTGSEIYAQYWSRDPASASTTSLSNAIQFVINP